MPRKTRANRTPSLSSESPSRSELFSTDKSREVFEKLNCKRKIWAEHSVVLDDVDPAIRENFESKGWLSLLEVDHPPLTALIRDFFSNLSCHVYDSNTLVRSWIRNVASMNFPYLFFRSLNEVHRSSAIAHRILLFLSLVDFPVGEPVHWYLSLFYVLWNQELILFTCIFHTCVNASCLVFQEKYRLIQLNCCLHLQLIDSS